MSCLLRNAKRCKSLLSQGLNEYLLIKSLDACVVHAVDIDKGPSLRGLTATSVAVSQLASFRSFNSIATPAGQRNGIDSEKLRHRRHDISFSSASNYIVRRSKSTATAPRSLDPNIYNLANALSMGRLLSGPLIATWILQEQWSLAVPGLIISGATDWLDGQVARSNGPSSNNVLGSYLDPLADKVLIGCVVGALGYGGALPGPLVAVILARDGFLIAGAFVVRAKSLQWQWPGSAEFFRISSVNLPDHLQKSAEDKGKSVSRAPSAPPPALRPLMISKVNTALQLALVGCCMMDAWIGWPGQDLVWGLGAATAGTTVLSCAAYVRAFANGQLLK